MKGLLIFAVIVGLAAVLALGGGFVSARETGKDTITCNDQFKELDVGGKGYLNYGDFQAGFFGVGDPVRNSRAIGVVNSGSAYSNFTSANTSRDGELTMGQYCAWKNRY
jgi:hypothetical protein